MKYLYREQYFNPRSPYEERRYCVGEYTAYFTFQSTLPIRGATLIGVLLGYLLYNFNPRSPYEERQWWVYHCFADRNISIHAPHTRSDPEAIDNPYMLRISIHAPHTRSDQNICILDNVPCISIHAPHTRSDSTIIAPLSLRLKHNFFANLSTTLLFSLIRLCQQVLFTNG